MPSRNPIRPYADAALAWALGGMLVTGLVLYLPLPDPEVAAAPAVLGIDLLTWMNLHRAFGGLFLAAGLAAALARMAPARSAIGAGFGAPAVAPAARHGVAALLAAAVAIMAAAHWWPVSVLLNPAEVAADYEIEDGTGEGLSGLPYAGAEHESMAVVAQRMGMEPTRVEIALQEAKLVYRDLEQTLEGVAARNGTTASAVYAALRHLEAPPASPEEEAALDLAQKRVNP
jgi:hypothetical protein